LRKFIIIINKIIKNGDIVKKSVECLKKPNIDFKFGNILLISTKTTMVVRINLKHNNTSSSVGRLLFELPLFLNIQGISPKKNISL